MYLLVDDVDASWGKVSSNGIQANREFQLELPWSIRVNMCDFALVDPTDVLWYIAQVIKS